MRPWGSRTYYLRRSLVCLQTFFQARKINGSKNQRKGKRKRACCHIFALGGPGASTSVYNETRLYGGIPVYIWWPTAEFISLGLRNTKLFGNSSFPAPQRLLFQLLASILFAINSNRVFSLPHRNVYIIHVLTYNLPGSTHDYIRHDITRTRRI